MSIKKLFLLFILMCSKSYTVIVEEASITKLLTYIGTKSTLVIFDVDNTLLYSRDGIGGDEWFYAMLDHYMAEGLTSAQALAKVVPEYEALQLSKNMEVVEEFAPAIVHQVQTQFPNVKVMALTTRGGVLIKRTIDQLALHNINFSINAPYEFDLRFDEREACYTHGMLFGKGKNKQGLMDFFLTHIAYKPQTIIFINDKEKYLRAVEKAVGALGIEFIGIRYSKLDQVAKNYTLK